MSFATARKWNLWEWTSPGNRLVLDSFLSSTVKIFVRFVRVCSRPPENFRIRFISGTLYMPFLFLAHVHIDLLQTINSLLYSDNCFGRFDIFDPTTLPLRRNIATINEEKKRWILTPIKIGLFPLLWVTKNESNGCRKIIFDEKRVPMSHISQSIT